MNYIKKTQKNIYVDEIKLSIKLVKYLDSLLLSQLCTMEGRINAIKCKYKFIKLTPIYINESICLIPLQSFSSITNLFINIKEILDIKKYDNRTLIIFKDNKRIIVDKTYKSFKENYKKASMITIQY